jgi:hypothetical protein
MNCSTSATGVTTAGALRPVRASDENAMPHSVHAAVPSDATQRNVSQRQLQVEQQRGDDQQEHRLQDRDERDHQHLAREVDPRRHGRAAQALEDAAVAFDRDLDGQGLEARRHQAGRDHAGDEVLGEADAAADLAVEDGREDQDHDDRERQREHDLLAAAQELADLELPLPQADHEIIRR